MTLDREKLTKPFRDLLYEMEHDDPVLKKLRRAHAYRNRARVNAGFPPLPEPDYERPRSSNRAA